MEAKFGGKPHHFYDQLASDVKAVEKKNAEWNLNDWKWDGALFAATPLNSVSSDCRSRQLFPAGPETPVNAGSPHSSPSCSVQNNPENEKGKRELEKRRKIVVFDCEEANAGSASLNLKLGEQIYPIMDDDAKCGKKTKVTGTASSRAVCQVEDCRADLSNAKDYHRRHKVCEMHSKANKVLVGNLMQRFCQQCSRFHALQEFDEGKRSCRRRLAGHNRRRRKTHPDNVATIFGFHTVAANHSDKTKDQDLLSHLLRSLASLPGSTNGSNMSGLLQGSEGAVNAARSSGNLEKLTDMVSDGTKNAKHSGSASKLNEYANIRDSQGSMGHCGILPASDLVQRRSAALKDGNLSGSPSKMPITAGGNLPFITNEPEATAARRTGMNNIDLNDVYDGSQDNVENLELYPVRKNPVNESLQSIGHILASNKLSPQHLSGNSDSTSSQSLSTSSGEAQSRTDRIVFKLFGKDPNDCPIALRRQILDWLSHSPTDIESYIKPGCIVLTIYLRLTESAWEELCCDLGSSLRRLVDASNDSFWKTGWVYARVQHSVAFIYDGQVVLDSPLPLKSHKSCWISSITPIAVSLKEQAQFVVKGFNLNRFGTRLLCAIQGKYLVQAAGYNVMVIDPVNEHDELQYLCFPCSIPDIPGRGFIEVEDHGLSSTFFPFIVAEQDVCSEICTLEGVIETAVPTIDINENAEKMETKIQAIDFIHEMGWLLHRNHLNWKLGDLNPNLNLFPFRRFKWLMNFSVDHDWCAVVKKLLSILFDGTVDLGDHSSIEYALLDMCLLHRAVQRNCRPMVELLLRFVPDKVSDKPGSEQKPQGDQDYHGFMFKPNVAGPAGLTPLHVAAGREGSENVLDVLTNDPGSVAIEACRADT